jgi:hypothetical protein
MKNGTMLATALFAVASFPLLAQQSPAANQPDSPGAQQNPSGTEAAAPSSATANPTSSTVKMSPISGELVSKLDSKTAKAGDSIVVQTKSLTKTADGTEIPKGSKLVGHVVGAQPGGAGENSQLSLLFDHIELKGGQSVPIQSRIQSIAPAGGAASSSAASAPNSAPSTNETSNGSGTSSAPQGTGGYAGTAPQASSAPAAGTVVAKTGQIAISTTSVPGVLLANNAPGQQDPRMAQTSSILLGAKQDIQLDTGTQVVVGVSAAGGGAQ